MLIYAVYPSCWPRNRYLPAVLVYVLAVLVKPQALLLGPIG